MIDKVITKHRTVSATPVSANTTSNKYTGVVAAVLNAACKEWEWIEVVPKFRKYPQPSHRTCWLRLEDWRSLEAELPSHLLLPARFALATGLRASKVFGLEWSQIDMPYRSMTHTGVHNKRGNTIPLNDTAMSVINEIKGGPFVHMSRVFTYKGRPLNDYGKAWYKALERAGIEDFPWHGFRHTFASWLGQSGAPDGVLDQLCGWAEKDTRGVYSHLDVEPLRMYSSVIDKKLAGRSVQFLHGKVFGEQPLTSEAM
jgi:integrase